MLTNFIVNNQIKFKLDFLYKAHAFFGTKLLANNLDCD